jgi:cytochrome c oxidase cbb3-type subunit 3
MTQKNNHDEVEINQEEKKIVLDHNYDGIREFDYPLPRWWVWSFILTVLFGVPYIAYYIFLGGPDLRAELNNELKVLNEVRTQYAVKMAQFDESAYAVFDNEQGLSQGLAVYQENCLSCHEENGKGDIGPNMTDEYWLNAKGTPETIYEVVINGRVEKGMPAWREDLTKEQILQVVHYIMSIKNTNVEGGKAPQGEKI